MFCKKGVPEAVTFNHKKSWTQVFSCGLCESFKNTCLRNICERLLLYIVQILSLGLFQFFLLTLPAPILAEEKKLYRSFYFHTSLWCLKRFYEGLKGIVKWAEKGKCDILLVSRRLWHNKITSFMNGDFHIWYSPATFRRNCSLQVYAAPFPWRLPIFIGKKSWRSVLEANKKQVPLKSYSLKIRIDFVNQILKNKEKVTQTRIINIMTRITVIFMSIKW